MNIKNRLTKLESKAGLKESPKENQNINPKMWERSMSALAAALGIERADVETALKELTNEYKNTITTA